MSSLAVKRIIAGGVGLLFAFIYGLWTMILTGGGHGNFIWFLLFLFVEFFGLYFPLMAVLAVDLRSFPTKVVFGSLIGFNLVISSIMIVGWINDPETGRNGLTDFERVMQRGEIGWFAFSIAAHFLPTLFLLFLLIRSILFEKSLIDEDDSVSLDLS